MDENKDQDITNKIIKLLKLSSSTTFSGEAQSALKIAYSLAKKNNLKIEEKDGNFEIINPDIIKDIPQKPDSKSNKPDKPYGIYIFDSKTGERVYANGYRMKDEQTYQRDQRERKQAEEIIKRYYKGGEI
jgi:hypothetical protein